MDSSNLLTQVKREDVWIAVGCVHCDFSDRLPEPRRSKQRWTGEEGMTVDGCDGQIVVSCAREVSETMVERNGY